MVYFWSKPYCIYTYVYACNPMLHFSFHQFVCFFFDIAYYALVRIFLRVLLCTSQPQKFFIRFSASAKIIIFNIIYAKWISYFFFFRSQFRGFCMQFESETKLRSTRNLGQMSYCELCEIYFVEILVVCLEKKIYVNALHFRVMYVNNFLDISDTLCCQELHNTTNWWCSGIRWAMKMKSLSERLCRWKDDNYQHGMQPAFTWILSFHS